MKADIKWLDDPRVFRVNRLDAHSDHKFYKNYTEIEAKKSSFTTSLNGQWDFIYLKNPMEDPEELVFTNKIPVPSHIEMNGYDTIHYINTMYPWEGKEYRRPVFSQEDMTNPQNRFSDTDYNPVGIYHKTIHVTSEMLEKNITLYFEGVEQAMYLFVNGEFVGYSEDTFTPSEFDITAFAHEGENDVVVKAYKRSTAAFLEDQDFFRFFGIFRPVSLIVKEKLHIEDLWIKPELCENLTDGNLALDIKVLDESQKGTLNIKIFDGEEEIHGEEIPVGGKFAPTFFKDVKLWDNKKVNLYKLIIEVKDEKGEIVEVVPYNFGFRKIEIKNNVILFNGERLKINGVNRHEWSCKGGRVVSIEDMEKDIEIFHRNNINSVRTCHYPDSLPWYTMCDENGIHMMAETNLESHGSWQKSGAIEPSWNIPGKSEFWRDVVLDRANTMFQVLKNHTSIVFWSLGNESYAEKNIELMNEFFKTTDPSRLVHYEGVVNNREFEKTISDVESRMYASPEEIAEYLSNNPLKPFLSCEFMHCMGNSLGGFYEYMDLYDQFENYHGGYIWDYIDQALLVKDEVTGEEVIRYGGDFSDRASDYEFSGNGIIFADRTEKPGIQEVKYYYGK